LERNEEINKASSFEILGKLIGHTHGTVVINKTQSLSSVSQSVIMFL